MAWGPLTTIYVITAELFPTKWRCTGYGFVYAAANFWGFVGVFVFLYAQNPEMKSFTYSYPCNRSQAPSDYYPWWNNACMKLNDCPLGRAVPIGNPINSPCIHCMEGKTQSGSGSNPSRLSGCNPFGLGTSGALAIMIPILMLGALFTQLLPVCTYNSLEDINYMNELEGEFLEAKVTTMTMMIMTTETTYTYRTFVYIHKYQYQPTTNLPLTNPSPVFFLSFCLVLSFRR